MEVAERDLEDVLFSYDGASMKDYLSRNQFKSELTYHLMHFNYGTVCSFYSLRSTPIDMIPRIFIFSH